MEMENLTQENIFETRSRWNPNWLKKSWVQALHRRLGTIYQTKFLSNFIEPDAIDEWCKVWGEQLSGITPDQIKYALGRMQREMIWPPNCVEFWQLCQAGKEPEPFLRLPPPKPLSEVGQAAMAKIKEMLKQKPPSKDWAYRILDRVKDGESLAPIAIQWAQEVVDGDMGRKTGAKAASKHKPGAEEDAYA